MRSTRTLRLAAILVGLATIVSISFRPTSKLHAAARPGATEIYSLEGGVSPPLREIAQPSRGAEGVRIRPVGLLPSPSGISSAPQQILDFAGIGAGDFGFTPSELPPWPNGAVGATQYVQGVSKSFAVFDRTTGALVFGPASTDIFWTNLSPDPSRVPSIASPSRGLPTSPDPTSPPPTPSPRSRPGWQRTLACGRMPTT